MILELQYGNETTSLTLYRQESLQVWTLVNYNLLEAYGLEITMDVQTLTMPIDFPRPLFLDTKNTYSS